MLIKITIEGVDRFIDWNQYCFTALAVPTDGQVKKGINTGSAMAHCKTFGNAVLAIAKDHMYKKHEDSEMTIQEFVDKFDDIVNSIRVNEQHAKIIESSESPAEADNMVDPHPSEPEEKPVECLDEDEF